MTDCCNSMTGKCEDGPGCAAHRAPTMTDHIRGPTNMHTENSDGSENGIVMFDEPGFPFAEFVCGVVWWIGSAVLVVLIFAAIGMALGFVNFG